MTIVRNLNSQKYLFGVQNDQICAYKKMWHSFCLCWTCCFLCWWIDLPEWCYNLCFWKNLLPKSWLMWEKSLCVYVFVSFFQINNTLFDKTFETQICASLLSNKRSFLCLFWFIADFKVTKLNPLHYKLHYLNVNGFHDQ